MKAALIEREGSGLVLGEIPVPEAAAGEVRIRIIGTSVNFADVMMERGLYHSPRSRPFVLGMDAYGLVDARGEPGSGPPPGTPVVAFPSGSYAEYALVDARLLVPAPTGVSREALQGIGLVGCTAYELLTRAGGLRPGESVLVHAAAGGVGSLLVQMARLLGAKTVIGQVGHPEKVDLVYGLGADRVLTDPPASWAGIVQEVTEGRGVDLVLNALQGETLAQDIASLADFGRLVVYGQAAGAAGYVSGGAIYPKNQRVVGYSFGHIRRARPELVAPVLRTVLGWLDGGRIRVPVGGRFPLARAAEAVNLVASGRSTGKVLVDVMANSGR
jgi:NADPH2:quinone reductase